MDAPELTRKEIEQLAWELISRFLLTLKDSSGDLVVADLHPGGGTYDCLSLISAMPNPKPIILLNRKGTSARVRGKNINGIWEYARKSGPTACANFILEEANEERTSITTAKRRLQARISKGIANWVKQNDAESPLAVCAWQDDPFYVGPKQSLLNAFRIPKSWTEIDPPYKGSDWSAWIYILQSEKELTAAINFANGEVISCDGTPWIEWSAFLPEEKVVPKKKKEQRVVSLPPQEINPEGLRLFRTVGKFDGYKELGKELEVIAAELSDNWNSGTPLPNDLTKLKGALFFESRRAHFMDGYPSESDLPYLRELVRLIKNLEN